MVPVGLGAVGDRVHDPDQGHLEQGDVAGSAVGTQSPLPVGQRDDLLDAGIDGCFAPLLAGADASIRAGWMETDSTALAELAGRVSLPRWRPIGSVRSMWASRAFASAVMRSRTALASIASSRAGGEAEFSRLPAGGSTLDT